MPESGSIDINIKANTDSFIQSLYRMAEAMEASRSTFHSLWFVTLPGWRRIIHLMAIGARLSH